MVSNAANTKLFPSSQHPVVLLFSGGVDCTLAACCLAEQKMQLMLLFCDNGCLLGKDIVQWRFNELQQAFPDISISLEKRSCIGLFKRLALLTLERDLSKYKTNLVCLGCKLAMHCEAILLCLKTGTQIIADGYNSYQSERYMEQRPEAIEILKNFSAEYNLICRNPVYQYASESDVKLALLDSGITPKSLEASCMFGHSYSEASKGNVVSYLYDKLPLCREYISKRMEVSSMGAVLESIHKIGAVILNDRKILVVRKYVAGRVEYIIPGGRSEDGETHEDTLRRELREELQLEVESYRLFGSFSETAVFEGIPINMDVYFVETTGVPHCDSEIKELLWIDRDYETQDIKLGTVLGKHVIPMLISQGLM